MIRVRMAVLVILCLAVQLDVPGLLAQRKHENAVIDLWMQGRAAFGVFVPDENAPQRGQDGRRGGGDAGQRPPAPPPLYTREGGERLATNALYDFAFLNLEGRYDAAAVKAIAEGLRSPKAVGRKALIVRIPPIDRDGSDAARARVKEALDLGADGVTIPHVQSVEEARQAIAFFRDAKANVWSPSNLAGEKLAMLMIEDPGALAEARQFADLAGYSILACGIGSLTQALGGNREAAEAGTQQVLAETKRVKLVNMLTATTQDVEKRVKEGFLALLAQGQSADEAIRIGRAAAGR
jgi:2-keto-3-deoxy-L-rhamnonate aldolase RhmA